MKIGFVLDDSLDSSDGVQQYILTLGSWFTSQGHQVHYLVGQTTRTDLPNIHSLSRNVAVRFNGNRMSMPLPASRSRLRELLRHQKFDVLHIQMPYSPFLGGRILRQAAKYSPQTALVGTFHILPFGPWQRRSARVLQKILKPTTKLLAKVWSVSAPAKSFAAQLGIKSSVLPNSINLNEFKVNKPPSGPFTIVFLGRLVQRKGCAELLRAIALLDDKKDLRVIIGGRGPQLDYLKRLADQKGLSEIVTFKGYVDEAQKAQFLAAADLAIFPSISGESFGIVLLEAMASGAGVVLAGDNPGYRSVLGELQASLFDPLNAQQLAIKIDGLLNNQKDLNKLHQAQQQLVKRYDVAIIGKKLLSYYQQLTVNP